MSSVTQEINEIISAADSLYNKLENAASDRCNFWATSEILEKHRWDAYKLAEQLREIKYYLGV